MYLNSPIKYTIAGKYIWKLNFNKPVESKTQFTKYSINVNCGNQQSKYTIAGKYMNEN